jgi:uncharacterized protein with WD repeat
MIKNMNDLIEESMKLRMENPDAKYIALEIDGYILQVDPEIKIFNQEEFQAREATFQEWTSSIPYDKNGIDGF